MKKVVVYTDGGARGNPGPGGYGAILTFGKHRRELKGAFDHTTNNRMEMMAVIEGLKALKKPCHVKIHSDSALIVNTFKKGWIENWQKKGWKKSNKKPVENRDLWEKMLKAMKPHTIEWIKVKGHADNQLNNRVDRLAVSASKKFQ